MTAKKATPPAPVAAPVQTDISERDITLGNVAFEAFARGLGPAIADVQKIVASEYTGQDTIYVDVARDVAIAYDRLLTEAADAYADHIESLTGILRAAADAARREHPAAAFRKAQLAEEAGA